MNTLPPSYTRLSDKVALDNSDVNYLIQNNSENLGYTESFSVAKRFVDLLCNNKEQTLREENGGDEWVKTFRENVSEKCVRLYMKKLGKIFDGANVLVFEFTIQEVPRMVSKKLPSDKQLNQLKDEHQSVLNEALGKRRELNEEQEEE